MREPGGLPSMGSYRVGHNLSDLAAAAAAAAAALQVGNWWRSDIRYGRLRRERVQLSILMVTKGESRAVGGEDKIGVWD